MGAKTCNSLISFSIPIYQWWIPDYFITIYFQMTGSFIFCSNGLTFARFFNICCNLIVNYMYFKRILLCTPQGIMFPLRRHYLKSQQAKRNICNSMLSGLLECSVVALAEIMLIPILLTFWLRTVNVAVLPSLTKPSPKLLCIYFSNTLVCMIDWRQRIYTRTGLTVHFCGEGSSLLLIYIH